MESITSISELNKIIEKKFQSEVQHSIENFQTLIHAYCGDDWKNFISFEEQTYTRNVLTQNKDFELVLIGWNKNQSSPWHNHPNQGCVMKILQGELTELRCNTKSQISETILSKNNTTYIHNSLGGHKIENNNTQTVSLHLYAPGNALCQKSNN